MRRPHRTWPQRLLLTLNITLVVVCLAAAGGVYWTYNQASALPRIDVGASLVAVHRGRASPRTSSWSASTTAPASSPATPCCAAARPRSTPTR